MVSFDTQALYLWKASVDSGSFKQAAIMYSCNPSTVSKNISTMERQVGAKLRSGFKGRLQLTDAGKEWYILASCFISEAERIVNGCGNELQWEHEAICRMQHMDEAQRDEILQMIRAACAGPAIPVSGCQDQETMPGC